MSRNSTKNRKSNIIEYEFNKYIFVKTIIYFYYKNIKTTIRTNIIRDSIFTSYT